MVKEDGAGAPATRAKQAREAEEARVQRILARDRQDRTREDDRLLAEVEVAKGVFISLNDTVIEPTPEWIEKGDIRSYTPRQPDGTVREITTVRRVVTPIVMRLYRSGKLPEEMMKACLWYRASYDATGLEGRYSISRYSAMTDSAAKGRKQGGMAARIPITEQEIDARETFRAAREAITKFYLKFFDAVVLHDIPLRRAARFAKCRHEKALVRFIATAKELEGYCRANNADMRSLDAD